MSKAKRPSLRFLIVDDKPFIRQVIHGVLTRANVREISHASNGAEALNILIAQGSAIDCILCDWNMGPVDGLELLRIIRSGKAQGCKPDVCFIMITGESDAEVVNLAVVLDTNGYILKPVSFEKLMNAITNGMARSWDLKSPKYYQAIEALPKPPG